MNEKDILKRRWEDIDNVFAKYQKQFHKQQFNKWFRIAI